MSETQEIELRFSAHHRKKGSTPAPNAVTAPRPVIHTSVGAATLSLTSRSLLLVAPETHASPSLRGADAKPEGGIVAPPGRMRETLSLKARPGCRNEIVSR